MSSKVSWDSYAQPSYYIFPNNNIVNHPGIFSPLGGRYNQLVHDDFPYEKVPRSKDPSSIYLKQYILHLQTLIDIGRRDPPSFL